MFLFYVLALSKKGTLFKEIRQLPQYFNFLLNKLNYSREETTQGQKIYDYEEIRQVFSFYLKQGLPPSTKKNWQVFHRGLPGENHFCCMLLSAPIGYRLYQSNLLRSIVIWSGSAQYVLQRTNDLSIGSTETKYIKLNTKTQNIFCFVNENSTTFLYTLTGGQENRRRKEVFLFKVYTKFECY